MNLHQQLAASLISPSSIFEPKANFSTLPSAELSQSLSELTSKSFEPAATPVIQQPLAQQLLVQKNLALPVALGFGKVTRPAEPLRSPSLEAPQVIQALAMLQEIRNKNKAQGPRIIGSSSFRAQTDLSANAKIHPPKSNG
jgi:hypothetical protein